MREKILAAAEHVFFTQGYGAASIEAIAQRAHIAKRTLYSRFRDKAELFTAVVHNVVENLKPPESASLFQGTGTEILYRLAEMMINASLRPQALALIRLVLAEARRFPELATAMQQVGARDKAIQSIAALLERETHLGNVRLKPGEYAFAAEQFIQLVVSVPQRRGMGLGPPMSEQEIEAWAKNSVNLFLNGARHMGS
ncbi:MAG: TetR/AcrR family transcriptional regulator [Bdellovibrionales bacterium]